MAKENGRGLVVHRQRELIVPGRIAQLAIDGEGLGRLEADDVAEVFEVQSQALQAADGTAVDPGPVGPIDGYPVNIDAVRAQTLVDGQFARQLQAGLWPRHAQPEGAILVAPVPGGSQVESHVSGEAARGRVIEDGPILMSRPVRGDQGEGRVEVVGAHASAAALVGEEQTQGRHHAQCAGGTDAGEIAQAAVVLQVVHANGCRTEEVHVRRGNGTAASVGPPVSQSGPVSRQGVGAWPGGRHHGQVGGPEGVGRQVLPPRGVSREVLPARLVVGPPESAGLSVERQARVSEIDVDGFIVRRDQPQLP